MTQIKSEKVKAGIERYRKTFGTGFVTKNMREQVDNTCRLFYEVADIAETDAVEYYAKELEVLKQDRDKYKALYETCQSAIETSQVATKKLQKLKSRAIECFKEIRGITNHTSNQTCTYDENLMKELKTFTQKLNEK